MKTTVHYISRIDKEGPVELLYEILKSTKLYNVKNIVVTRGFKRRDYFNKFENLNINIYFCSRFNIFKLIHIISHERSKTNSLNYHSYCTVGLLYSIFCPSKIYKIHSCLVEPGIQAVAMNGLLKGRLIEILNSFGYKFVDVIVAGSNGVAKSLINLTSKSIFVIPNSVSRAETHQHRFNHPRKYAISVCRFSLEKNILGLIKSYKSLVDPEFDLVLIGDGKLRNQIELAAGSCKNILILGFIDKFEKYLVSAEFYVSFSKVEGLPMAVLSAMAHGLPLILSQIGGHEECIDRNGRLINPDDFNEFQLAVNDVLMNRLEYSRQSLRVYEQRFSPETLGDSYSKIYV